MYVVACVSPVQCDFVRTELLNRLPENEREGAVARAEKEAAAATSSAVDEPATESKESTSNANGSPTAQPVTTAATTAANPSTASTSATSESPSQSSSSSTSSSKSFSPSSDSSSGSCTKTKSPPSTPSQDTTYPKASDTLPVGTACASSPRPLNGISDKEKRSADQPVTTKPDQPVAKKAKSAELDANREAVEPDPTAKSSKNSNNNNSSDARDTEEENSSGKTSVSVDSAGTGNGVTPALSPHAQPKGKGDTVVTNGESAPAAEDDDDDDDEVSWPPVVPWFSKDHIRTHLQDVTKVCLFAWFAIGFKSV